MKRTLTASGGAAIYLIAILVNLGVQLLGSVALVIAGAVSGNAGVSSALNYVLMALLQAGFLLTFALFVKKSDRGLAFPVRALKWYDILLGVLAAGICVFCFIFPAQWFAVLLEKIGYNFSTEIPLDGALDVTLCVIVTVIIAPVCEELVFRGALLTGLTKKFGVIPSVILSGLAFSLMHMNPEQTVYQFFMGCACAYLAICSGSVLCPMIVHACNNLIAIIFEFTGTAFLDVFFTNYGTFAAVTVAFLIAGVIALYFIGRLMMKSERHGAGAGLVFDLKRTNSDKTAQNPTENNENATDFADENRQNPTENNAEIAENIDGVRQNRTKNNCFAAATDPIKAEAALDEEELATGKARTPLLGKRSQTIYLGIGLFACLVVWILVFAVNVSGLM